MSKETHVKLARLEFNEYANEKLNAFRILTGFRKRDSLLKIYPDAIEIQYVIRGKGKDCYQIGKIIERVTIFERTKH
jgi:hypothetical protein